MRTRPVGRGRALLRSCIGDAAVRTDARRLAEAVIAEAERQGWRVVPGSRHRKLYAPDGCTIETIATTPSPAGGVEASIRRMRRAGFVRKGR